MQQPPGYEKQKDFVCELIKGIYGLKQAAAIWNEKLDKIIKELEFQQSSADPCLYFKVSASKINYLVIYVDDFLIAAKSSEEIDEIATLLKQHFQLTDLGFLKHYLGIEIKKNKSGIYSIKQSNYIDKILKNFGLLDTKVSNIPMDPGYAKSRTDTSPMKNSENYQKLIGALLYIAVNTRPDIAASVTILSQHNTAPTEADWTEAKRVARYLKSTKNHGLALGQEGNTTGLTGFADANWADDKKDRKSNSGYIFLYAGSPISWGCRKQSCVTLSSTEAEYISLAEACQEAIWIRRLLQDIYQKKLPATVLYEDNQSCLKLIENKKFSNRTKHVDVKYHFIKDIKQQGSIDFEYCPTSEMIADMLTKPLAHVKLKYHREKAGLTQQ